VLPGPDRTAGPDVIGCIQGVNHDEIAIAGVRCVTDIIYPSAQAVVETYVNGHWEATNRRVSVASAAIRVD
jgi:hypothetical protein